MNDDSTTKISYLTANLGVVYNFDKCKVPKYESEKTPLYIITPTYPRPVQIAELTRLAYVLQMMHINQQ